MKITDIGDMGRVIERAIPGQIDGEDTQLRVDALSIDEITPRNFVIGDGIIFTNSTWFDRSTARNEQRFTDGMGTVVGLLSDLNKLGSVGAKKLEPTNLCAGTAAISTVHNIAVIVSIIPANEEVEQQASEALSSMLESGWPEWIDAE